MASVDKDTRPEKDSNREGVCDCEFVGVKEKETCLELSTCVYVCVCVCVYMCERVSESERE